MKSKNKVLYHILLLLSIILFLIAIFLLNYTKFIVPIVIVISVYLFVGAIMKLGRMNHHLKNTIMWDLDLLLWLP